MNDKTVEFFWYMVDKVINNKNVKEAVLIGNYGQVIRANRDEHEDLFDRVIMIDRNTYDNAIEFTITGIREPFRLYAIPHGTFYDTDKKIIEAIGNRYIKEITFKDLTDTLESGK